MIAFNNIPCVCGHLKIDHIFGGFIQGKICNSCAQLCSGGVGMLNDDCTCTHEYHSDNLEYIKIKYEEEQNKNNL